MKSMDCSPHSVEDEVQTIEKKKKKNSQFTCSPKFTLITESRTYIFKDSYTQLQITSYNQRHKLEILHGHARTKNTSKTKMEKP